MQFPRLLTAALLVIAALAFAPADTDPAWLERLAKEDRAALDPNIGFAPPAFPADATWIGGDKREWKDLRGKIVVLQSFSTKSSGSRNVLLKSAETVKELLKELKTEDVIVFGLHTPEGADKVEAFFKQKGPEVAVVVDPSGSFCDELGIFKRPTNVVVDRTGTVRYMALNPAGLPKAITALVSEEYDAAVEPRSRDAKPADMNAPKTDFPKYTTSVGSARDLRGQKGPAFAVENWISGKDEPRDRLLLLDFFATWCGPCMAAIPHMNEIAGKHGQDVFVIAISDESKGQLEQGLAKKRTKPADLRYGLAVDTRGRMKSTFGVTGIPYCAIMSSDGVVRWQGHPTLLTDEVLTPLVAANKSLGGRGMKGSASGGRWQKEVRKR